MDDLFATVFDDLVDRAEERLALLAIIGPLLPGVRLAIVDRQGQVVGDLPETSPAILAPLLRRAQEGSALVSAENARGERRYAFCLEPPDTLVFSLPVSGGDISADPMQAQLCLNTFQLALARRGQNEALLESAQLHRQIEVLKKQHVHLIDDNHEQYLLLQKREKEYAKELEKEIARQTKELRAKNRELEAASRLKSEFLANMSHELRTPLNAIIGFSGLLIESELSAEQDDFVQTISKAADNLLVLINDILDLAKVESGKLDLASEPVDLAALARSVSAMLAAQAAARANNIRVHVDSALPPRVLGDEVRLRQILINLVGNALKFTEHGWVDIQLKKGEGGGDQVVFEVRDNGIGIAHHRLQAIFEKFTQADGSTTRQYGGTGLGLSICYQLVTLMGGQIVVESAVGTGSVFRCLIPLAGVKVEKATPLSAESAAGPVAAFKQAGSIAVLLVEDNLVNQKLARLLIQRQGCQVEVAADGLEALARLQDKKFHLILMDIHMPNMDGLEATRKIRLLEGLAAESMKYASLGGGTARIPIIGLTASASKEDEQNCYEAGMDGFLTKPINKEKFVETLNGYRQKRSA